MKIWIQMKNKDLDDDDETTPALTQMEGHLYHDPDRNRLTIRYRDEKSKTNRTRIDVNLPKTDEEEPTVVIKSMSEVRSVLTLERNHHDKMILDTPFGALDLMLFTRKLYFESENETYTSGNLYLEYVIDSVGQHISEHIISLEWYALEEKTEE